MVLMENFVELLRTHPVFISLGKEDLNLLAKQATRRQLHKGEILALQGDVWPYLFLVAEGKLDAVKESSEGRNLLVTTFGAGELFWGLAFFQHGAPQIATLEAQAPSRVYLWLRQDIEPVFIVNGRLPWELCHLMIQRMQRASTIVEELAFQPVAGRLAHLLLELPGQESTGPIARSLTLDDMAARIGSTREMVCRFLQKFADDGLIKITRTEFEITSRERLANMAQKEKP
jgi:CRP/FNR family transcriptional regulator